MTNPVVDASPRFQARVGGWLYLVIIVAGLFGEMFVRASLVAPGDPAATAANIVSSQGLWRLGIAANLFHLACAVVLAMIFYALLRPVSRSLALLAVLFNMVAIVVEAVAKLFLLTALLPLGTAEYLRAFEPEQRHALAYLSIRSHELGFGLSLLFFGFECLVLGYLIFKSSFLPRALGVLMQVAGLCYLVNSFALVLTPGLSSLVVLVPAFVAEVSLCLWLIVRGVDATRWHERAVASRAHGS